MKAWAFRKIFRLLWFTLGFGFLIWNWSTFQSRNLPAHTLENSTSVTVTQAEDFIKFSPNVAKGKANLIFFQGGMTDPKAYAPLCKRIAEMGHTSYLVKAKWRLPRYDYKKTLKLFDVEESDFVIAGHSQGGLAAAQLIHENPDVFKGLILLGTSHPRDIDLSGITIPVIKLYAEHDGLASVNEVMQNKSRLPAKTEWLLIPGGNHSQFGYLGTLLMDDHATISREQQQQVIEEAIVRFLEKLTSTE